MIRVNSSWRAATAVPGSPTIDCGPGASYPEVCEAAASDVLGATALRSGLRRVLTGRRRTFEHDCGPIRDGSERRYRVRIGRLDHFEPARFLVEHEEITELTQAQDAIQQFGERVLEVQAEERQRLAMDLHDSVGQNLVSLGLGLAQLRIVAPQTHGIARIISDMTDSLQEAHAQIRSLSYLLNPPWPEHGRTLESTVQEFVQGFGRRAGLRVQVRLQGGSWQIDRARELTIFRILQEALVNVHRHAHANVVVVELVHEPDVVMLNVRDDGHGFPSRDGATSPLGVGIMGMRARVRQLGGELHIVSGPTGTALTVKIPAGRSVAPSPDRPGRVAREERSWEPGDASVQRSQN